MSDRETVQTLAEDDEPGAPRTSSKAIGSKLGRYTIVKLLGRGGVGAVYEADDPELGRRVAIKVLREDRDDDTEQLRREAQALARLVHQNVIMVYDVGVADGEVFLVMQLVEGETIDAWFAKRSADAETILRMFRQAGEGLMAAHAAGLVHCDFKPHNVLVDDKGMVRVGDFGLARATRAVSTPAENIPTPVAGMTTIAGTPAYMAPEQFAGKVTAASDQFAFCVALWECLVGERPFEDSGTQSSLDVKARGERRALPSSANVPRDVVRALERGMASDPHARFPSMAALLAALEPKRSWAKVAALAGAIGVLAGGAIVYVAAVRDTKGPWEPPDPRGTLLTRFGTKACAYAPAIDEGGTRVIFDRTEGAAVDLYEVPLAGGEIRQLTSAPGWEWRAQRGRRRGEVVYLAHDQENADASTVSYLDLDTRASTPAVRGLMWDATVAGNTLYFSPDASPGIRKLEAGVDEWFLQTNAGDRYFYVTASPTGDRLAVTKLAQNAGRTKPCVADIATREVKCIEREVSARPVFGPSGRVLYIAEYDRIVRHELATGEEQILIGRIRIGDAGLAISPDGKALVYSTCAEDVRLVDFATGKSLVDGGVIVHAVRSSRGELAWTLDNRGVHELWFRSKDGVTTQLTTAKLGSVAHPSFTPDGTHLVFGTSEPNPGIRSINLERIGGIEPITTNPLDRSPVWTASNHIAFMRSDGTGGDTVFVMKHDGTQLRQLDATIHGVYGSRGKELLVVGSDPKSSKLLWLDAETGATRDGPTRPSDYLSWATTSPSGNWVVYQSGASGQAIHRIRVEPPGELELVKMFEPGETGNTPSIDDDGHVIIAVSRWYGDLVRLDARDGSPF